ncbi:MAG: c-type cytochrome, partial [Caldimonas sp.]
KLASTLPDASRNSHGNIAEQVRPFGEARGTDTRVPSGPRAGTATPAAGATIAAAATAVAAAPAGAAADAHAVDLLKANSCTACHGMTNKIVGPAFQDVASRYAGRADAVDTLAARIRSGGQGAWGTVAMPEQAQLGADDARAIAAWLVKGAK